MGALRKLATLIFILSIPVALVTTNIRFLVNEPRVYEYSFDQYDAVRTTGIERPELIRAGGELRDYFNNGQDTIQIRVQRGGSEVSLFNPRETQHMKDVKDRIVMMNRVQELSILYALVFVVAVVLWAREITPRALAGSILAGCAITLLAVGGLGAFAASGFSDAWIDFHEVLFTNDLYLLNPATDHLIQMFPLEFWQNIVFLAGLPIVAEAALLLIASGIYLGVTGKQASSHRLAPHYAA